MLAESVPFVPEASSGWLVFVNALSVGSSAVRYLGGTQPFSAFFQNAVLTALLTAGILTLSQTSRPLAFVVTRKLHVT